MVQGVDLWLNNPRRGEEACGTSGMKAAHERRAEPEHSGRLVRRSLRESPAAGRSATASRTREDQDALHASAIYSLLENEIVPMFYERREQTPREWMRRVKQSLMYISPHFDCRRMVREYMTRALRAGPPAAPAHACKADYATVPREGRVELRACARSGTGCASSIRIRVRAAALISGTSGAGSRRHRSGRPDARRMCASKW